MIVAIPADPTRAFALAAYWPTIGYYSWATTTWLPTFDAAACLLPFRADPASVCGDTLLARVPDQVGSSAPVVLQLIALDGQGRPVRTVDCEVLCPS
jgi:hypothetical protein